MPEPLAICIEDLTAPTGDSRYLQCVALVSGEPGLTLDARGAVQWEVPGACGLWVAADERLMLHRAPDAPAVTLRRGGRTLEVPEERPVVVLDGDELQIGGRRLRIHVHGAAPAVTAPTPLLRRDPPGGTTGRAAVTLALGTAAGLALAAAGEADGYIPAPAEVPVRARPPAPPPRRIHPDAGAPKKPARPKKKPARPKKKPTKPGKAKPAKPAPKPSK